MSIKKNIFKALALFNRKCLPSLSKGGADIMKLKTWQKILLAYKWWVLKNSLD